MLLVIYEQVNREHTQKELPKRNAKFDITEPSITKFDITEPSITKSVLPQEDQNGELIF